VLTLRTSGELMRTAYALWGLSGQERKAVPLPHTPPGGTPLIRVEADPIRCKLYAALVQGRSTHPPMSF
jgi:hypothetical protein